MATVNLSRSQTAYCSYVTCLDSLATHRSQVLSVVVLKEIRLKKLRLILRHGCYRRLDAEADGLISGRPRLTGYYFEAFKRSQRKLSLDGAEFAYSQIDYARLIRTFELD
jgi:hypothetical protein